MAQELSQVLLGWAVISFRIKFLCSSMAWGLTWVCRGGIETSRSQSEADMLENHPKT